MKKVQFILLVLIVVGIILLCTQSLWVPKLVDYIIKNEQKNTVLVEVPDLLQGYREEKIPNGIKYIVPAMLASTTNLSSDSYISKESVVSSSGSCIYSVASTSDAGAGNRYEETIYTYSGKSPCTVIRYFIHYSVFENYPSGSIKEFNKQALIKKFDAIRGELILR